MANLIDTIASRVIAQLRDGAPEVTQGDIRGFQDTETIPVKITGSTTVSSRYHYDWTEQLQSGITWVDKPGGMSGTSTKMPALEKNNANITTFPFFAQLRRRVVDPTYQTVWEFDRDAGGGGGSANVEDDPLTISIPSATTMQFKNSIVSNPTSGVANIEPLLHYRYGKLSDFLIDSQTYLISQGVSSVPIVQGLVSLRNDMIAAIDGTNPGGWFVPAGAVFPWFVESFARFRQYYLGVVWPNFPSIGDFDFVFGTSWPNCDVWLSSVFPTLTPLDIAAYAQIFTWIMTYLWINCGPSGPLGAWIGPIGDLNRATVASHFGGFYNTIILGL